MKERTLRTVEWLLWGAIFLLVAFDRLIKFRFTQSDVFLENDYVNEFIAFGIPIPPLAIVVIIILVLLWLGMLAHEALKKGKRIQSALMVGLIAGGVSNAVDRFLYGGVVDYIATVSWFPVFNLADTLITASVAGIALELFFSTSKGDDRQQQW